LSALETVDFEIPKMRAISRMVETLFDIFLIFYPICTSIMNFLDGSRDGVR
jgi:hypothetical protein